MEIGELIRRVMGVLITLAIMQLLHQRGGRISNRQRNRLGQLSLRILFRCLVGHIQRVGLGSQRHIYHRLGQMHVAFRHAQKMARLIGGDRQLQCPGISHAHILAGEANHPPGHIQRILPCLQHPGQPVNRRIRV